MRNQEDFRVHVCNLFEREIEGGVSKDMMQIVDEWLDDEDITDQEAIEYEMTICNVFDDHWFTCTRCAWTLPMVDMAEDCEDEWYCRDCED